MHLYPLASLSDHLTDPTGAPEEFSRFYVRLVALRFPLDIAEILDLRSLLNQAIDGHEESAQGGLRILLDRYHREFDTLGVKTSTHRNRLARLMAVLSDLHVRHQTASRSAEDRLRKALKGNSIAHQRSTRYGKSCLLLGILMVTAWLLAPPSYGGLIEGLLVFLGYLVGDFFYSLSTLKRERDLLDQQLTEILESRISCPDWKGLIRHLALVLGYARISGVEPFLITEHREALLVSA